MDICAVSFNVRGLSTPLSVSRLRSYLSTIRFNVLFLQEHKQRLPTWNFFRCRIWRTAKFFCSLASDGVHADCNSSVVAGCGGLATAVGPVLAPFVSSFQVTACGRALMVTLDGLPTGPLGLLNVYGPNDSQGRALLWETLCNTINPSRPWLVGGDFNMVSAPSDHSGGAQRLLAGREAFTWEAFQASLGLVDCRPAPLPAVQYSWDNHRLTPVGVTPSLRVFKRLDRFYLSASLASVCTSPVLSILATHLLSDHSPVQIFLSGSPSPRKSPFRMNLKHLRSPILHQLIRDDWVATL
jgi:exonuclease III